MVKPPDYKLGIVIIGRNEGERLKRCLRSVIDQADRIVYVDSGSTDDSVDFARSLGVDVVELDMSQPFTMARGRNAGWRYLLELDPNITLIQFVDGDCEVDSDWLQTGIDYFIGNREFSEAPGDRSRVALVAGWGRERHPDASIYNQLADVEWRGPTGVIASVGGIMMMRVDALLEVNGFRESMIAGEEPEMCCRLRLKNWQIVRLPVEMILHDAAIFHFGQWWKRVTRTGHAYAEGAALHGRTPLKHHMAQLRSAFLWAVLIPLLIIGIMILLVLAWGVYGCLGLGLFAIYPVQVWRTARAPRKVGFNWRVSLLYGLFMMIGKFAQLRGILKYWSLRLRGKQSKLIEYKNPATPITHETERQSV